MASPDRLLFEEHHVIEQQVLDDNELIRVLSKKGLFDGNAPRNLLYLPDDRSLAAELKSTGHPGGPLGSYEKGLRRALEQIEDSDIGQAALNGDPVAQRQAAAEINGLCDTLKAGLINNDLVTNKPLGGTRAASNLQNDKFFKGIDGYGKQHAEQIEALSKMPPDEAKWGVVTKSEANVKTVLEALKQDGVKAAKGDALEAETSLKRAIGEARSSGRLAAPETVAPELRGIEPEPAVAKPSAAEPPLPHTQPAGASEEVAAAPISAEPVAAEPVPRGLGSGADIAVKGVGAAGVALMAYDFVTTGNKVVQLEGQGNITGAESARTHFIGRNAGGIIGGFGAGFLYGAVAGSETGPGALLTGLGGGVVGAFVGEKWADQKDREKVFTQTDRDGNTWSRDPNDPKAVWMRPIEIPTSKGGYQTATAGAGGRLADELNYKAANASYELGLANPPVPKNPYELPAKAGDPPAFRENPWIRDAQTGIWSREVIVPPPGGQGLASVERRPATAERAAELDRQSNLVIAQNAANTPAAIAARYQVAYNQFGWNEFGPPPDAVRNASAQTDTLQASDGHMYTRNPAGEWTTPGMLYSTNTATGNTLNELNAVARSQATGLQEMAGLAATAKANPTPSELSLRSQVAEAYASAGIAPSDARIDAAVVAVARNQARDGITSEFILQVRPDQSIVTLVGRDGGDLEVKSVTTAQEITQAQQQAPPVTPAQPTKAPTSDLPGAPVASDVTRADASPAPAVEPVPPTAPASTEKPVEPPATSAASPANRGLLDTLDRIAAAMECGDRAGLQKTVEPFASSPDGQAFFALAKTAADRERESAEPLPLNDPRDFGHPEHAFNQSIREQLITLHAKAGIYPSDAKIDPLTAAVALNARENRINQISQVQFNADNSLIIATQGRRDTPGDVRDARSLTPVQPALETAPEQSYRQMSQVTQQQTIEQNRQQQIAQTQQAPAMGR